MMKYWRYTDLIRKLLTLKNKRFVAINRKAKGILYL